MWAVTLQIPGKCTDWTTNLPGDSGREVLDDDPVVGAGRRSVLLDPTASAIAASVAAASVPASAAAAAPSAVLAARSAGVLDGDPGKREEG
jgi:hypothetical protein